MTTLEHSPQIDLLPMELPLMSSLAVSPARTSVVLAHASGLAANAAVCGENMLDWFANYDPGLSSWKTAQSCFVEGLETFSETWPTSGMMQNGRCFLLAEWVPHTHETACFFWHTPTTNEKKPAGPKEMGMVLRHMAGESVPNTYIRLRSQLAARTGLRLPANPTWLEWLMGFPPEWTEITPLETP